MGRAGVLGILVSGSALALAFVISCSSSHESYFNAAAPDGGGSSGSLNSEAGFGDNDSGEPVELPEGETRDPVDCSEAATTHSYVGCDYWPTVTPNAVWNIFDYAVVIANTGGADAEVHVTGPNSVDKTVTVPPGELRKVYLPWVTSLKGLEATECGNTSALDNSVLENGGAYHLVSTRPVIVYQFNALEYEGKGGESEDGGAKDWSTCPGTTATGCGGPVNCFSYSNDATLLLPSTAMTNNYRVQGLSGGGAAVVLTVTSTQDDTQVNLFLPSTAKIAPTASGPSIPAASGGKVTLTLAKAGDVAEFVSTQTGAADFSGALVQSTKPVQVISSIPCIALPKVGGGIIPTPNSCDHIEETILPAETLGKLYVVAPPSGPKGAPVKHQVRIYGNQDATTLTYKPFKPEKCPDTLNAGQVGDCSFVDQPFVVSGDKEFGVATFLLSAAEYPQTGGIFSMHSYGDPSQTIWASIEQYRTKYVFLAPNDYPLQYADITATEDAEIMIDGKAIAAKWTKIGEGPFGVHRVDLTKSGKDGAHTLVSKKPVGLQVIGFGDATSFQYPGGLNLKLIAPPPVK